MTHVGNRDHESAMCIFDLVFTDGLTTTENNLLLLIKACTHHHLRCCIDHAFTQAIILFVCGNHDAAISRLNFLIDVVDDRSLYVTVQVRERSHPLYTRLTKIKQAQMCVLLGDILLREGDNKRAMELLRRARVAVPTQKNPHLVAISLVSSPSS